MHPTIYLVLLLAFSLAFCREGISQEDTPYRKSLAQYDSLYEYYGVEGCFALYNLQDNTLDCYNPARYEQGFLPASTFKIPNSLIALETGVINGPEDTIYWDGTERWNENWNRDNTLAEAFRLSCVPCYQQIARKVGVRRMRKWLAAADYGNIDIGKDNLDTFWLEGDSRISPAQQAGFLLRLYREELPFKKEYQRIVKQIMLLEEMPEYKLYGKTGWAQPDGRNIGWFVGFFETEKGAWIFVNQVENEQAPEGENQAFMKCRRDIAMAILQQELLGNGE